MPGAKHTIKLKETLRFFFSPYRVPFKIIDKLDEKIQELLKEGIIRRSNSPISSPAFLVLKPNGYIRFVVDFRKLNAITLPIPSYFLQLMNSSIL